MKKRKSFSHIRRPLLASVSQIAVARDMVQRVSVAYAEAKQ